jgi:hypothetical protein
MEAGTSLALVYTITAGGLVISVSLVTPPERTLVVGAESRVVSVPAEDRVYSVPAESRVVVVD